jgi:predicted Zn-dependent protease
MERSLYTHRVRRDQVELLDNRFHGIFTKDVSRQVVTVLEDGRLGSASGTFLSDPEVLTAEARRLCPFSRQVAYGLPTEGQSDHPSQNQGVQ